MEIVTDKQDALDFCKDKGTFFQTIINMDVILRYILLLLIINIVKQVQRQLIHDVKVALIEKNSLIYQKEYYVVLPL